MSSNNGFLIENKLKELINNKKFFNMDPVVKNILKLKLDNISNDKIFSCEKNEGKGLSKKTDLEISVEGEVVCRLSIKSGTGNSIHQENIYSFVEFLESFGAPKNQIDALLFFHWGDTSYDGSISKDNTQLRMSSREIITRYPRIIETIRQLFNQQSEPILNRVFRGSNTSSKPDILVYTNNYLLHEIIFSPIVDIIKHQKKINVSQKNVQLGNLTFQNWNRCLKGQELTSNKHRNDIQFKYSKLYEDLLKINNEK
ncbi:hypothetical protein N9V18_03590 [bacterium]|nr:hypothetical protein [bacterium]